KSSKSVHAKGKADGREESPDGAGSYTGQNPHLPVGGGSVRRLPFPLGHSRKNPGAVTFSTGGELIPGEETKRAGLTLVRRSLGSRRRRVRTRPPCAGNHSCVRWGFPRSATIAGGLRLTIAYCIGSRSRIGRCPPSFSALLRRPSIMGAAR